MRPLKPKRGAIIGAAKPKPMKRGFAWSKASKPRPVAHGVSHARQWALGNGKGAQTTDEVEWLGGVFKPLNGISTRRRLWSEIDPQVAWRSKPSRG